MNNAIHFGRPIIICHWIKDEIIATVSITRGLGFMFRSGRFDTQHATADVRTLADKDAAELGVSPTEAVTFKQFDKPTAVAGVTWYATDVLTT